MDPHELHDQVRETVREARNDVDDADICDALYAEINRIEQDKDWATTTERVTSTGD